LICGDPSVWFITELQHACKGSTTRYSDFLINGDRHVRARSRHLAIV
jgi:hypothetical protein